MKTGLILQKRDYEIFEFLRVQGFATFNQLEKLFFRSQSSCSHRLCSLQKFSYIKMINASDYFKGANNRFTPILLGLGLNTKTKIICLTSQFRKQIPDTNRLLKHNLCLHQLLLNDARIKLNSYLENYSLVLNDPQLKTWSLIDAGRRKEFTPDLSYESSVFSDQKFSLAIELERTLKNQNRYLEKFNFYDTSSYTHVLYLYVYESHLTTLLNYSGRIRKYAFAHYLKPQEVFSNTWGYLNINDWVKKVQSIQKTA